MGYELYPNSPEDIFEGEILLIVVIKLDVEVGLVLSHLLGAEVDWGLLVKL
jgi:hypothetical protein